MSKPLCWTGQFRNHREAVVRACAAAALLTGTLPLITGCLSPLQKHAAALASATAPVVDQAAAAYSSANAIYSERVDYEAAAHFDDKSPVYNPRKIQTLLSAKDIQVRLAVLAAFQEYVKSVVAMTNGTDTPELQAAAKSAGENLSNVGNILAPSVESVLGIAAATASTTESTSTTTTDTSTTTTSSSTSTPAVAITPEVRNGITTAVDALGQFLINRKTKKELPPIIIAMDPHVKTLCDLLESDINVLNEQEQRDYNYLINQQTLFLRTEKAIEPEERRQEIMKLPEIVRREQASTLQLSQLQDAIVRLELTHHALAAEAQGNNPQSLQQKLGALEAAGENLGKYYSSLPSN